MIMSTGKNKDMTDDSVVVYSSHRHASLEGILKQLLTVLLLSLLLGCSGKSEHQNAEQSLSRAKAYYNQGQLKEAVIELKNVIRLNSNNLEARSLLGDLHLSLGDPPSAVKEYRYIQKANGDPTTYMVNLGEALVRLNSWQDLLKQVRPVPGLGYKDRARIYAQQGAAYLGLKKIDAARQAFAKAIELDDSCTPAWLGKAALAIEDGSFASAQQLIRQAREHAQNKEDMAEAWRMTAELARLNDDNKTADEAYRKAIEYTAYKAILQSRQALFRIELGDYVGARENLDAVAKKLPHNPEVLYGYGLLAVREGRFDEALNYLGQLKQIVPNHAQGLFYLGVANFAQGNLEDAATNLDQSLSLMKDSITVHRLLAEVRYRQGKYDDAARVLEPIIAKHPDNPDLQSLMGKIYIAMGQTKQGSELLASALTQKPQNLSDRAKLGLSLIRLGDNNAGLRELEQVSSDLPGSDNAKVMLMIGYIQSGKYEAARKIAKQLHDSAPDQAEPWNYTGMVEFSAGNKAAARRAFEKALAISPDSAAIGFNLARVERADGNNERAKELYEHVLVNHPNHLRVLLSLMSLEAELGNDAAASRLAERAIKSHPKELAPRLWLARDYLRKGDPKKSLELFQEIEDDFSDNPGFLAVLGEAQLRAGKTRAGMETYKKLSLLAPKDAQIQFLYARACAINGSYLDLGEALQNALALQSDHPAIPFLVQRLIALSSGPESLHKMLFSLSMEAPDNQFLIKARGEFALKDGRYSEAIDILEDARRRFPDKWQWSDQLARAYTQKGNAKKALELIDSWLKSHPKEVQAWLLKGKVMMTNNEKQAYKAFSRVVVLDPDNADALNNLAWLLRDKDVMQAKVYAERALKLEANYMTRDTMAVILMRLGEDRRAEKLLQQAFGEQPRSAGIRYHMAQAEAKLGHPTEAKQLLREVLKETDSKFSERNEAEALLRDLDN